MARKTVRVDVPNGKPEELSKLAGKIVTKHTDDGQTSPLDNGKMAKLASAVTLADEKNASANKLDAQAQTERQLRDRALGIDKGQTYDTPDTVLNLVSNARDRLLNVYEGNEEKLGEYGFNVVVGTAKSPTRRNGGNGQPK